MAIVGLLQDDVDPLVSVMKVDKAPLESYADVGGLDQQIQEIKARNICHTCTRTHFFILLVLYLLAKCNNYVYSHFLLIQFYWKTLKQPATKEANTTKIDKQQT